MAHKTANQNSQVNNLNSKQNSQSGKRPDVRDNLDSRKNEEQEFKGTDLTHNKKEDKKNK